MPSLCLKGSLRSVVTSTYTGLCTTQNGLLRKLGTTIFRRLSQDCRLVVRCLWHEPHRLARQRISHAQSHDPCIRPAEVCLLIATLSEKLQALYVVCFCRHRINRKRLKTGPITRRLGSLLLSLKPGVCRTALAQRRRQYKDTKSNHKNNG